MIEQRVSLRYARAILETAVEGKIDKEIYDDFLFVIKTLNSSKEFAAITTSPVVQHWRKKKIYDEIFKGKINDLTLSFLTLLTDKRRDKLIPSIVRQYVIEYDKLHNRLPAEIVSAIELDDSTKNEIVGKLAAWTKMQILPEFAVDPNVKGGMLVRIDDWVFDATIRNQLQVLYRTLAEGGAVETSG